MITAITVGALIGLGAAFFGGYKYGHSVATKYAQEAAKLQKAAKDLQ